MRSGASRVSRAVRGVLRRRMRGRDSLLCAERVKLCAGAFVPVGGRWPGDWQGMFSPDHWSLTTDCGLGSMVPAHGGESWFIAKVHDLERNEGIRWMPWHQEAMKDVARCEKPWGAASRR